MYKMDGSPQPRRNPMQRTFRAIHAQAKPALHPIPLAPTLHQSSSDLQGTFHPALRQLGDLAYRPLAPELGQPQPLGGQSLTWRLQGYLSPQHGSERRNREHQSQ